MRSDAEEVSSLRSINPTSFQLDIPSGLSEKHEVTTFISMALPAERGGDGQTHSRAAIWRSGLVYLDPLEAAPKTDAKGQLPYELRTSLDWSEPQMEPPGSNYAGRWASHAIAKGYVQLWERVSPTFVSRQGELKIRNSMSLTFSPQGVYMSILVPKQTCDLSQPLQQDADTAVGDQLPPYST